MTQQPCTRLQNGQNGMIIPILPSLVQADNHQHRQDNLIHLADASSHGVADRRTRSLSSQLPNDSHGSSNKASHPRVGHSSTNKTRTYGNSLDSAIFVEDQDTRHLSVSPDRSRTAEVTSLVAMQRNPLSDSTTDSITRETSERATCEDYCHGQIQKVYVGKPTG